MHLSGHGEALPIGLIRFNFVGRNYALSSNQCGEIIFLMNYNPMTHRSQKCTVQQPRQGCSCEDGKAPKQDPHPQVHRHVPRGQGVGLQLRNIQVMKIFFDNLPPSLSIEMVQEVVQGLVCRGETLVIPEGRHCRYDVPLREWVGAHQGENATKRQLRVRLWFPGFQISTQSMRILTAR